MKERYTLRSRTILHHAMHHPGRGDAYTVRSLAQAVGLTHHSQIGHLLSGARRECSATLAHRIAEALGVGTLVLFAPTASTKKTKTTTRRAS